MSSTKSIQIRKDIDDARCTGNWTAIPDLARRYKKYNSEGTILEQTVVAEAAFIQTLTKARTNSINYQADSPDHISMEDRLDLQLVKPIQSQLIAAIQLSDPNHEYATQKEFAKIILARTHFECGEYDKAIEIIEKLSFEKEQVSQGYGLILFLTARAIKAISYELTGNETAAIQSYEGVEALLAENPNVKHITLIEWAEESLYRATLLGLKQGSQANTPTLLGFMRQYQKRTALQPNHWRLQKRLVITRHSLRHASVIYRSGNYCLPANQSQAERDPQLERQFFIMEQSQLHTIYEKMLYLDVPLPRAGQVNSHVLDFVDQFASDFELIGTTAHDLRGFVEVLDRASQRTFNSPLITRHLFHALVRLGEFEETEHALHSYLYLVGLVSHGWKETRYDGPAVVSSKTGSSRPVPNPRPDVVDQEDSHEKKPGGVRESIMSDVSDIKMTEKESSKHTLQVLLAAIKMYCQDLGRSVEAVEMAEIAKEFYQKQHKQERMTVLLDISPCVYRAIGIAYGLLGSQTLDPELRPTYHETSLNYLKQALELNSHAWQSFYQLALQQAEMRDIGQAIQSVTQAIQRNPNHVPSWHLLTLLISCPVQDDYKQALKTCDMGLQQAHMEDQEGEGDINQFDEVEQHMMYHITRILLMHTMHGPESALESSETLFSLFRKVAMPEPSMSTASSENLAYAGAHHGMIVSGSFGNLSELNLAAEQRKRGRSTSNSTTMSQLPHSAVELGSRSHDIMLNPTTETKKTGRARSASNLSMQPSPLGPSHSQLLSVPDTSATTQQQQHHHHLPHGLHLFRSRSSSIRKSQQPENLVPSSSATTNAPKSNVSMQSLPTSPYDMKNAAGNSVASLQSIAPSIMSTNSILQPSTIPTKPSTRMVLRKERSDRILSDLWLLTARMFIQLGKLDEAHKALEEAENVDWTSNPQVWCVLGQLLQAEGDPEQAQAAFYKSLAIDPHDVTCRLELAKSHLSQDNQEIAEGILDVMTKSNGWNCAEAWFHLGEIYKNTDRIDRTKACLFYALELESTTPIQPFSVLSRFA